MLSHIWNLLTWSKAPVPIPKNKDSARGIELQAIPDFRQSLHFFKKAQSQDPAQEWHAIISSYEIVSHPEKYSDIRKNLEEFYRSAPRPPTPPPEEEKTPGAANAPTQTTEAETCATTEKTPTPLIEQPTSIAPDLSNKLTLFRPQEVKISDNTLDQRRLLLAQIKKNPPAEPAHQAIPTAPPLSSNWLKK